MARRLPKKGSLFCWVMTSPTYHRTRVSIPNIFFWDSFLFKCFSLSLSLFLFLFISNSFSLFFFLQFFFSSSIPFFWFSFQFSLFIHIPPPSTSLLTSHDIFQAAAVNETWLKRCDHGEFFTSGHFGGEGEEDEEEEERVAYAASSKDGVKEVHPKSSVWDMLTLGENGQSVWIVTL